MQPPKTKLSVEEEGEAIGREDRLQEMKMKIKRRSEVVVVAISWQSYFLC